jgi:broad specificity phosphatase PhoE
LTRLIFVRHGQTDGNVEGRWQGWTDTPLNELGKKQAALAARRLGELRGQIHALYSSPLSRACQTAQPIARSLDLPVHLVEDLKEFHFGEIESMTFAEVADKFPQLLERRDDRYDLSFAYPGGETREGFMRRLATALDVLIARHPEETIVIVSHGGVLRATMSHLFPEETELWTNFIAGNCSITYIQVNGHHTELVRLDDREHLQELEITIT